MRGTNVHAAAGTGFPSFWKTSSSKAIPLKAITGKVKKRHQPINRWNIMLNHDGLKMKQELFVKCLSAFGTRHWSWKQSGEEVPVQEHSDAKTIGATQFWFSFQGFSLKEHPPVHSPNFNSDGQKEFMTYLCVSSSAGHVELSLHSLLKRLQNHTPSLQRSVSERSK